MRRLLSLTVALAVTGALTGCSLFGLGTERKVPEGDGWRTDVVTALRETPGVTSTKVTVNDVDPGTVGGRGPLVKGTIMVTGDPQPVVDDALRRMSEVLGEGTDGVMVDLAVSVDGGPPQRLSDFGYDGVGHGAALWDATH